MRLAVRFLEYMERKIILNHCAPVVQCGAPLLLLFFIYPADIFFKLTLTSKIIIMEDFNILDKYRT